jgi:outer membrane lipoprotein LolB
MFSVLTGCANTPNGPMDPTSPHSWSGRLVLKTFSVPTTQVAAAFELQGTPEIGRLSLLTPLGTTLASAHWRPGVAELHGMGPIRTFDGLDALTAALAGTPLPVTALFAWLGGSEAPADGWQVDLSGFSEGRLFAQRQMPPPHAEIRLVLDNPHPLPP